MSDDRPELDGVIGPDDDATGGALVTNAEGLDHLRQLAGVDDDDERWEAWVREHVEVIEGGLLMVRA